MPSATRSIVLIGMMGAGKSSVGRRLERATGLPVFDTDELVMAKAGRTIPEIFAQQGETAFRDFEAEVLSEINPKGGTAIIVTGGGIVLREGNVARL